MNQLDYQPAFSPGAFQHNGQASASYPSFQQNSVQQQHQQQNFVGQYQQAGLQQNGMYNSPSGPYTTTAPHAQSVSAPAQQQVTQSASPQQANSPFAQTQQPLKYPMAAPPLPQTPSSATQQFSPLNTSAPQTPQSPGTSQQESERVQLLLDINGELFEEISSLQVQGKGGAVNPKQAEELKAAGQDASMASEEYINALRRVQANLSYLASKGNANTQNQPPGPAHMSPPAHMPQMQAKYDRLKELFPGWPGYDGRAAANAQRGPSAANMNGAIQQ